MKTAYAMFPAVLILGAVLAACDNNASRPQSGGMTGQAERKVEQVAQKTEQAVDDTAITAKVKMALLNAEDLKSGDISVDTDQGRVTLTGTVPAEPQAKRAASIAGGVEGVRNVENRLIVKATS